MNLVVLPIHRESGQVREEFAIPPSCLAANFVVSKFVWAVIQGCAQRNATWILLYTAVLSAGARAFGVCRIYKGIVGDHPGKVDSWAKVFGGFRSIEIIGHI